MPGRPGSGGCALPTLPGDWGLPDPEVVPAPGGVLGFALGVSGDRDGESQEAPGDLG